MMDHKLYRKVYLERKFPIGIKGSQNSSIFLTFDSYEAELTLGDLSLSLSQRREVRILKFKENQRDWNVTGKATDETFKRLAGVINSTERVQEFQVNCWR